MFDYIWLVPVFPAIGVLINGLLGRRIEAINKNLIHWIACGAIALSFIVTCTIFYQLLQQSLKDRCAAPYLFNDLTFWNLH